VGNDRRRRGAEVIREVVAEAIARDLSDPRLGFVTLTGVDASPDFATATVYFTTLTRAQREPSMRALHSARGLLQSRVGRELRTRHTPHLDFVYDETQDRARRVTRLIDDLAPGGPPPGEPPPAEPDPDDDDAVGGRW
jgi:ribosome-binding factor A